jgi:hypothetical protein
VTTLVRRANAIRSHYGVTPRRMGDRLARMAHLLDRFGCRATLPVTAAAVERNPEVIRPYAAAGTEFAVHGLYHVDHVGLSARQQMQQIGHARRVLEAGGVEVRGFRAPYLRCDDATIRAVGENGFLYDSSQAVDWPLEPGVETDAYRRVLPFYGSRSARDHVCVPRIDRGIVRVPYCLPDDESAVDRLRMSPAAIAALWCGILRSTHESGELFTLGVHPERIEWCAPGVTAVLDAARGLQPHVWIAQWWRDRSETTITVLARDEGRFRIHLRGPSSVVVLVRDADGPCVDAAPPWAGGYACVRDHCFEVRAPRRPVVGVHRSSPSSVGAFLREQGYIVEDVDSRDASSVVVSRRTFSRAEERTLLDEIESTPGTLVRLGPWPDGARSALAVTGDIDALTISDYALRFLGR